MFVSSNFEKHKLYLDETKYFFAPKTSVFWVGLGAIIGITLSNPKCVSRPVMSRREIIIEVLDVFITDSDSSSLY